VHIELDHLLPNIDQAKEDFNRILYLILLYLTAIAQRFNIDEVHKRTSDMTKNWQNIRPKNENMNLIYFF